MGVLRTDTRIENVEAQLKALDQTIGNFMESQRGTEESIARNIRHIEESVKVLNDFVNHNVLTEGDHITSSLEDITSRLGGLEKQLKAIKNNTSKPISPSPREGSPSSVAEEINSEVTNEKIEELETRLEKAEDERNQAQALLDETLANLEQWKTEFETATTAHADMEQRLKKKIDSEKRINRNLFEKVQEMKGNIRVMCRIRPAPSGTSGEELVDFGPREPGDFSNSWGKIRMPVERKNAMGSIVRDRKSFDFERIFGPEESNDDIFNEIGDLIECALEGQKVGIFAYGQTGSGKTYTLSHRDLEEGSSDGIIPRTLASIFETAGETSDRYTYSISLSVLEIYTNNIYDLLKAPVGGQKIETRLEQATVRPVDSLSMAEEIIEDAIAIRTSSSTEKNANSSRSHLIITFRINRESLVDGSIVEGLLNLVDLAGSERSAAEGLEGQQLQEGILINRSLLSLNRVITALGQGTVVAFDTALTRALRPCLSHDSKTLMFVMVSPFKRDLSVSLQTLEKGQEATSAKLASANRKDARGVSAPPGAINGAANPLPSPTGLRFPRRGNPSSPAGRNTPGTAGRGTSSTTGRGASSQRGGRGSRGGAPRTSNSRNS
ncbi:P-loop containing nucleoside triphosphate hydrolase protein [Hypoxylon cercidicola]|nr:P-loop containing nucleoside triphosphate hydrolase protein [Hypoxylon cercidicola]